MVSLVGTGVKGFFRKKGKGSLTPFAGSARGGPLTKFLPVALATGVLPNYNSIMNMLGTLVKQKA